ncbi:M28 family peptidase [Paludisphaera mucosa]|uniref:M28 family peptidase n=1 Tax=Paludisphaera mucosa TaxID=3030827 RepID=A0ABT6FGM7_9BACT|nr:M28 family peptidase [Paludisphaera mucosa]MDG3006550.1 M28 family peptidase [Paludisphaera mucosa]
MMHRDGGLRRVTGVASGLATIAALTFGPAVVGSRAQAPVGAGSDAPTAAAASTFVAPAEARLKDDVSFLADDAQEGRAPGTKGIEASAEYIARQFKDAGLQPPAGGDGYFQKFTISGQPRLGETPDLIAKAAGDAVIRGVAKADFNALAIGSTGALDAAPIVFAGYGITADRPEKNLKYDDYAGVDAAGKAVLVIRREPQQNDEASPFDGKKTSDFATFRHKATNAFQHGAAMLLVVNDLAGLGSDRDVLLNLGSAGSESQTKLPVVHVTRDFADKLLKAAGEPTLAELEGRIDKDLKPLSRELKGVTLTGRVTIDRPAVETKNVVGVLEGAGPKSGETIVVGGHYDHLGRGGLLSGSLAFLSTDVHNGADDNASGTSLTLELARRLGARRDPPARRIVFIGFSGEERGLLGSQYYVDHPLYPLASTVAMVNFDMVGRMDDKKELTMIGTGTSPGFTELVDVLGKDSGMTIKKVAGMTDGFGGSDHQSFYAKDVPVLFAFTGIHPDYHRPSDDWQKINYGGMARIADYVELILLDLVRRPERPEFTRISTPRHNAGASQSASTGMSVTLGVMPDYADESKAGMKLSNVRDGGPAAKAGIKGGDVIIAIGGKPIATIYDYMESLGRYKPGEVVDVLVKRDGQEVKIPVELGKANAAPRQ